MVKFEVKVIDQSSRLPDEKARRGYRDKNRSELETVNKQQPTVVGYL